MSRRSSLAWPYLAGLTLLVAVPLMGGLALAFTEYSGIGSPEFVGFDNFSRLIEDEGFWRALGNSFVFMLLSIPLRIVAALGFALLLHRRARGATVGRVSAYLPSVISDAAFALLWLWLLNPLYGPLAVAAESIAGVELLTTSWGARIAVALMGAFQIGEAFIVALAARRALSNDLYESASVDGASAWFTLRKVTLPLMAPIIWLLALRDVVLSFQVNFVPALLITDGGPDYATTFLPLYAYRAAFRYFRLGYASAMVLTMFAITAVIVFVQYRVFRRWQPA